MHSDDVAPSVMPRRWPSRHSGPGYVANPVAPDFELSEPLRNAAARWLNLVPAEHRHDAREPAKDVLETLREHTRSCPDHPLRALWVAHRHLGDPAPAVRHVLRIGPRSWRLAAAAVALAASAVGVTVSVAAEMALLTAIVAAALAFERRVG